MELLWSSVAIFCCTVIVLIYGWKILNWVWFGPKKLEKSLRQHGFYGNPYRVFLGDFKEMAQMTKEALSKPINFSDDFVPRIMPFFHKIVSKYGQNCFLWLGPYPVVLISDPENIREILSKSYGLKPYNPLGKMLARGLASYDTDKWAKHRRLINPTFELEKVKHMVPSFYMSCSEMLSKWEKMVPSDQGPFELDVSTYLQTLTSDAISRTAFGSSYEEGRKIFDLQKEQATLYMKSYLSLFIPGWRFVPTKTNRRIKHNLKEVESLVLGIIDKRMKAIEAGDANSNDLLDILLESNLKEIQQKGSKFGMSLEDVVEECKLFYIAGQETTSALLVWTMILLSKHSDWQARAREEVMQVTMVFHEVLRLYPPGAMIARTIHNETALGRMILPAGVQLILPAILLHHDTKMWGDDAKEFNPGRFSEGVLKAKQGQFSYFPFGWGPRICIGQNFAMMEAKTAVAMILQRYSFELSPSYSHAPYTKDNSSTSTWRALNYAQIIGLMV
ncbi:hypothetical protein DH2020_011777 [Rehmannia glutinosa]|uniref:Cytochrome P450 CYP72A219-like n=1 Tax=Rehmannia glutinosa TaxID=99300 RepID=A0ABR0XEE6_REHGL